MPWSCSSRVKPPGGSFRKKHTRPAAGGHPLSYTPHLHQRCGFAFRSPGHGSFVDEAERSRSYRARNAFCHILNADRVSAPFEIFLKRGVAGVFRCQGNFTQVVPFRNLRYSHACERRSWSIFFWDLMPGSKFGTRTGLSKLLPSSAADVRPWRVRL